MAVEQLVDAVKAALAAQRALRIVGAGSKAFYGHATEGEVLETRFHQGITTYEPTELVITVRCGTTLADVEAALLAQGQLLPFEPPSAAMTPLAAMPPLAAPSLPASPARAVLPITVTTAPCVTTCLAARSSTARAMC